MNETIINGIAIIDTTCIISLNSSGDIKLKAEPKIFPKPVVVSKRINTTIAARNPRILLLSLNH
ncbi:MAG: hypothetical protein A2254_04355 [Ignavibacteria bacterium RIFOXYA2_FULL_35_9]|nr:MAG: hypothetical protein A2254_04355 [Ignavibacteria bacterium RIFOXYA2_FULL_35_9]